MEFLPVPACRRAGVDRKTFYPPASLHRGGTLPKVGSAEAATVAVRAEVRMGGSIIHPVLLKKFLISQSVYPARGTTDKARLGSYEIGGEIEQMLVFKLSLFLLLLVSL